MEEIIVRYLHFIGIIFLSSALVVEHLKFQPVLSKIEVKQLAFIDMIYGISAGLVLITGMLLWFAVGKPAEFYSQTWIFHLKFLIFIIIAALSLIPTIFLMKTRKHDALEYEVPKKIIIIIRIELFLLLILPLLAVLMANGFGRFGN